MYAIRSYYEIALALDHAARQNIVHRDIKPDNVMLTEDGNAKLCDLGLAIDDATGRLLGGGTELFQSPPTLVVSVRTQFVDAA